MSFDADYLIKGQFKALEEMTEEQMRTEISMWRQLWQWVPPEVKYYVARTGELCGITLRNYKRHVGTLLETYWELQEIELGVHERIYDSDLDIYMHEKKRIRVKAGNLIAVSMIAERLSLERALIYDDSRLQATENRREKRS